MRSLLIASLAVAALATPAQAATSQTVYGYAWADGTNTLRITPITATRDGKRYRLATKTGAKELRLGYGGAAFRRLTVACGLKETEGRTAQDAAGLGTTRCTPKDLAFTLQLGPNPVKITYSGGKAIKVSEFQPAQWYTKSAKGLIKRVDADTVSLGARHLTYTWRLTFNRVTAKCADGWLTGEPVNADQGGLGTKGCTNKDFGKVFKGAKLATVHYNPFSNELLSVWEVFGDA
ncbi:hypothetical protein [Nonomuraea typhae]|uniref:hypothetical protein n=1 Tax=Nonomuraea typhae TaxID=2603600 RepID=UPI0012FC7216|nr:hypothetical protein [Nonomuraea typhae]